MLQTIKIPLKIGAFALMVCVTTATAQPKTPRTLTAPQYEVELKKARDKIEQIERREPRDVRTLLKPLDAPLTIKRDDGATQKVEGDIWGQARTKIGDRDPAKLTRPQSNDLKNNLSAHLSENQNWIEKENGAYFQNSDAKKWVKQLQNSGQVSVQAPAL